MCSPCTLVIADDATAPGNGIVTNLHVTDLNIEGPVPNQTCTFGQLRELDLDGGNMTGTIPEFLTTCFPYVNEIDLSYNHVSGGPIEWAILLQVFLGVKGLPLLLLVDRSRCC